MTEPVLFYVRHGETEWNKQGRLQGQQDSVLTDLGREQAVQSAVILRDLTARDGYDLASLDFIASPLGRARDTMERLRATLGLDPTRYRTDARLAELRFGRWEGVAYPELLAQERDALAARERDKWNFVPPGGESYAQLLLRIAAWHATVRRASVIVAHGGTARALVAVRGIAQGDKAAEFDIDQGVVYLFAAGAVTRYA
jgi:broad specificity phosphatase PhoE